MTAFPALRATVRFLLEHAEEMEWSLQGLGMLRLHMGDNTRLHVWDLRHAYPGASPIHDHLQWGLTSTIVSGRLVNYRYFEDPAGELYQHVVLKAGYGCEFKGEPRPIRLRRGAGEIYLPGDGYRQRPDEIHWTVPDNGTVTVMRKEPTADGESARVFWPAGTEWGSAEPRRATREEITSITKHALEVWQL
jgi:hypothetical protein